MSDGGIRCANNENDSCWRTVAICSSPHTARRCSIARAAEGTVAGHLQDMALADPRILLRLEVELRWRQITVTTVLSSDCNECKKESLAP